jgi:Fur family peroxide stress response transcriptional regulator
MRNTKQTKDRVDAFRELCKQRGLRVTPQRMEVFREVACSDQHPAADEVLERVRERIPNISLDTVYRILYWLEDEGLISRVPMSSDRLRFDGNADSHHHFVCSRCGAIQDFTSQDVDRLRLPDEVKTWGRIQDRHLQIRGICRACLRKSQSRRAG